MKFHKANAWEMIALEKAVECFLECGLEPVSGKALLKKIQDSKEIKFAFKDNSNAS